MGEEVRKKGFDIPYPNGLSPQYVYGKMNIHINNLRVRLHDDPSGWVDVDSIATFNYIEPTTNVAVMRYDIWLLTLLIIYLLVVYVATTTTVELETPFIVDFNTSSKGPMVGWGASI